MPVIDITMYEGRTQAQKDEAVEVVTRELSRIFKRGEEHFTVNFNELPLDENAPDNLKKPAPES